MTDRCTCYDTLVVKDLNRWFKEKWVDVSRKDKDGKHPPCGRSEANTSSKGYPKCRPSVKVSDKTPKTSGQMTSGEKQAATKRKRAKKQGVGGKPTIVKEAYPENQAEYPPSLVSVSNMLGADASQTCTVPGCNNPVSPVVQARYANPLRSIDYTHYMCPEHANMYDFQSVYTGEPMDLAWRLLKQSLELQPPMTQGVEEQVPMQEDIPMVDMQTTAHYNDPCDCAEEVRRELRRQIEEYIEILDSDVSNEEHMGVSRETVVEMLHMTDEWDCEDLLELDKEHNLGICYNNNGMSEADQMKYASEPIDIAMRLLKNPVSPEAKRHKIEYDKKYESNPERVKYREELNAERRKRGIYGKGGPDMSHTKRHTLVAESPHANRARHFKSRGTLK